MTAIGRRRGAWLTVHVHAGREATARPGMLSRFRRRCGLHGRRCRVCPWYAGIVLGSGSGTGVLSRWQGSRVDCAGNGAWESRTGASAAWRGSSDRAAVPVRFPTDGFDFAGGCHSCGRAVRHALSAVTCRGACGAAPTVVMSCADTEANPMRFLYHRSGAGERLDVPPPGRPSLCRRRVQTVGLPVSILVRGAR